MNISTPHSAFSRLSITTKGKGNEWKDIWFCKRLISETVPYYMPISLMIVKRTALIWVCIYLFISIRICKRSSGELVPWNSYLFLCIYLGQSKLHEVLREKKENFSQSISNKGMCVTDRKKQDYRKQPNPREQVTLQKVLWKAESPGICHCYLFSSWGSNCIFEDLSLFYFLLSFSSPKLMFSILCKIK